MEPKASSPRLNSAMDPEIEERRAKWRENAAASLIAGTILLLLLAFAVFLAITAVPVVKNLPAPEATVPDGAGDKAE
jgi:hypothetical protein